MESSVDTLHVHLELLHGLIRNRFWNKKGHISIEADHLENVRDCWLLQLRLDKLGPVIRRAEGVSAVTFRRARNDGSVLLGGVQQPIVFRGRGCSSLRAVLEDRVGNA